MTYPNSTLPMPQLLCLCTTCRLISGGPAVAYIDVPSSTGKTLEESYLKFVSNSSQSQFESEKPSADTTVSFKTLKGYDTSPGVTRYFCTKCGCHIFCRVSQPAIPEAQPSEWVVATGVVNHLEDVVDWKGFYWVDDTLDGGIGLWLPQIPTSSSDGTEVQWKNMERQSADKDSSPPWEPHPSLPKAEPEQGNEPDTLSASCLCKSIRLTITRPNAASIQAFSPYPDLIIPYHTSSPPENPSKDAWFLRANKTKYLAGLCTCPTCRHALGMPIQSWAFIPRCNILMEDGSALNLDKFHRDGKLVQFSSTEDTCREFCAKCGASVFWHCGWRSDVMDVSTGLLDPAKGARCESWLEWWNGRVSFKEIGNDGRLADGLEAGLREWSQKI
ncbi:hypothetical protein B7463_g7099, partial [Scytalidium lignicola]